jgi:hypothetical protein
VAGHSAGGHQVAMLLNTRWMEDYGLPRDVIRGGFAICLICGRFDFLGCSPCCSSPKTSFKLRAHFLPAGSRATVVCKCGWR